MENIVIEYVDIYRVENEIDRDPVRGLNAMYVWLLKQRITAAEMNDELRKAIRLKCSGRILERAADYSQRFLDKLIDRGTLDLDEDEKYMLVADKLDYYEEKLIDEIMKWVNGALRKVSITLDFCRIDVLYNFEANKHKIMRAHRGNIVKAVVDVLESYLIDKQKEISISLGIKLIHSLLPCSNGLENLRYVETDRGGFWKRD